MFELLHWRPSVCFVYFDFRFITFIKYIVICQFQSVFITQRIIFQEVCLVSIKCSKETLPQSWQENGIIFCQTIISEIRRAKKQNKNIIDWVRCERKQSNAYATPESWSLRPFNFNIKNCACCFSSRDACFPASLLSMWASTFIRHFISNVVMLLKWEQSRMNRKN